MYVGKAVLAEAIVVYTFYQSITLFFIFLPICCFYPLVIREKLVKKRREKITQEFKEALQIVASFLSAGYSTENAFRAAVPELRTLFSDRAMIVREFEFMIKGMQINKPVDAMLKDFGYRSGVDEISNFAEIYTTAKQSGGQLVQIISHTAEIIRDKVQIQEDIRTLNAAKRYEQKVMNVVPFLIIIYMNLSSGDFFRPLYTTLMGRCTMTICLGLYLLALYMAEHIMEIEV